MFPSLFSLWTLSVPYGFLLKFLLFLVYLLFLGSHIFIYDFNYYCNFQIYSHSQNLKVEVQSHKSQYIHWTSPPVCPIGTSKLVHPKLMVYFILTNLPLFLHSPPSQRSQNPKRATQNESLTHSSNLTIKCGGQHEFISTLSRNPTEVTIIKELKRYITQKGRENEKSNSRRKTLNLRSCKENGPAWKPRRTDKK